MVSIFALSVCESFRDSSIIDSIYRVIHIYISRQTMQKNNDAVIFFTQSLTRNGFTLIG